LRPLAGAVIHQRPYLAGNVYDHDLLVDGPVRFAERGVDDSLRSAAFRRRLTVGHGRIL
jgi:hypothetical protein